MTMASCDTNPSVEHPGTATQVIGESGSSNSNPSTTPSRKRGRPRTARLRPNERRRRASLEARAKNPKRRKQMTECRLTEGMVFAELRKEKEKIINNERNAPQKLIGIAHKVANRSQGRNWSPHNRFRVLSIFAPRTRMAGYPGYPGYQQSQGYGYSAAGPYPFQSCTPAGPYPGPFPQAVPDYPPTGPYPGQYYPPTGPYPGQFYPPAGPYPSPYPPAGYPGYPQATFASTETPPASAPSSSTPPETAASTPPMATDSISWPVISSPQQFTWRFGGERYEASSYGVRSGAVWAPELPGYEIGRA